MKLAHKLALVVAAYGLALGLTLPSFGLTDDDDFYIPAGISYVDWLGKALRFDDAALSRAGIDRAFEPNHEHPPVAKYAFGLGHALFAGWLGPIDAARTGTVLWSTLLALAMFGLAVRHLGEVRGFRVGLFAVVALAALPRFFFHSHAATLDVPVAATYTIAAYFALRAERSRRAALLAGLAFGVALATKLNAPFLLVPYGLFVLVTRLERTSPAGGLPLPPIPLALVAMLVIGPLVFLALWPWLWFDTAQRLGAYFQFHLKHYGIYFLYFGRVYVSDPFAPWHAPLVMAATTIPLATSGAALYGLASGGRALLLRLRDRGGPDTDARREGDLLWFVLLNALVTIGVVAFGGTPKYGGEKLFMPFFPFWCLLAGYGLERLGRALAERVRLGPGRGPIELGVPLLLAASGLSLSLGVGEHRLSAYNALAGGLRGATALGFERQYYDVASRELAKRLSALERPNLKVHFLPNNWEYVRTYRWYKRAGVIRSDLSVVEREEDADLVVLTHERRFARYADDLARYRGAKLVFELVIDGTPIYSIVERRR